MSEDVTNEVLRQVAYTIGNFLGDGSASAAVRVRKAGSVPRLKSDKRYVQCSVRFGSLDLETMHRVRDEIEAAFGRKHPVFERTLKSGRPFHCITACSREVFDFFTINTALKSKIPEWYFSADDETKKALIAGLMDTDGYVSQRDAETYSSWTLGFGMNERPIVESLASLLKSVGVQVGKIGETTKGEYRTLHRITINATSYAKAGCYFVARRKQEKLEACVAYRQASETRYAAPLLG